MAIARKRGTYNVPDVIDITNDDDDCDDNEDVAAEESTTSPVTMPSVLLSPEAVGGGANIVTTTAASMQDNEDSCDGLLRYLRKTQKQASVYRHVKKKVKMEDDGHYKAAFKAATTLAAAKINSDSSRSMDSVDVICDKFNEEYGLAKRARTEGCWQGPQSTELWRMALRVRAQRRKAQLQRFQINCCKLLLCMPRCARWEVKAN